jgi:catechol 2,3-dioxygenase-like lactoylglutathione lyase family enzyme
VIDHVGYLVRDLDEGVDFVRRAFGAEITREVDRPQWTLVGYYLGPVEVFTFTDPERLQARLGDAELIVDHVAHAVDDIAAAMARLPGVRWSGPDLRETVAEPFDLGTAKHIWTTGLQLIEHARAV